MNTELGLDGAGAKENGAPCVFCIGGLTRILTHYRKNAEAPVGQIRLK